MTNQYKLIDAPVNVKTIKIEDTHLTAIEKKAIKEGMKQGIPCFKSGRKIYTISHVTDNVYRVEIEEKQTTIFNRLETVKHFATFSVCLEKAKQKSIEQLEVEQLQLMLAQEEPIETKEETKETIDNTVVETVKETIDNTVVKTVKETKEKTIDNKVVKLQAKLTRLNAQLAVTKGNRSKAKIVIEILKVESVIEQLQLKQKEITLTWEQTKSLNALTGGKFIFSKLTQKSKQELLKIIDELEDLDREKRQDNFTGKGLWKKPSKASIKRSEKRSNKYRILRERVERLELIQENSVNF